MVRDGHFFVAEQLYIALSMYANLDSTREFRCGKVGREKIKINLRKLLDKSITVM